MPNTREKLIELLSYFADGYPVENRHIGDGTKVCEIADHLIANGVTVQQWIPVTERLPENTGRYLTANIRDDDERRVFDLWFYSGKWYLDEEDDEFIYEVTHWMPLPQPPKED